MAYRGGHAMSEEEMTFPVLKVQSIVNCLAELDIPMTAAHIKEPQPAHLRGIYETIVETITGANLDSVRQNFQIPFHALDGFQNPELHDKSLMNLVLDSVIIRTMHAAGVADFSMADIYHPTFKRTKVHLSALINLCKFWAEQHGIYEDMMAETDEITMRKDALEDENEGLVQRIEEMKRTREEQAPVAEALEVEIQGLTTEINKLNTEQASLQTSIQNVKKETNEMADSVASLLFQIQAQSQDCNVLKSQIVQSPERIKREIVHKSESLEKEKARLEQSAHKARALAGKVEALGAVEGELAKVHKCLNTVVDRQAAIKTHAKEVEALNDGLVAQRQQFDNLQASESQLQRQIQMAQERLARLRKQQEMKRTSASSSMEKIKMEREMIAHEQAKAEAAAAENAERCAEFEGRIEQLKAQHQREMETARQELKELYKQVAKYDQRLQTACSEAIQL